MRHADRAGALQAGRSARAGRHPRERDCAWRTDADASRPGIFGPRNLPEAFRRDWVANANDSYWLPNPDERLEGFAGIIGCEKCERTLRTRMVYRYVLDRLAGTDGLAPGRKVTTRRSAFEHENRVFGAELARGDGDLQTVCEAADGGDACDVLDAWDGRSDLDQPWHPPLPGVLEAGDAPAGSGRCRSTRPTRSAPRATSTRRTRRSSRR